MRDQEDISVDEWNLMYDELTKCLSQQLAHQLTEDERQGPGYIYELNQQFTDQGIECQVETLSPDAST